MSADQGPKIPGGDEDKGAGYLDVGQGIYVRVITTRSGDRVLHVFDRRPHLGKPVVDVGGGFVLAIPAPNPTNEDQQRAACASAAAARSIARKYTRKA